MITLPERWHVAEDRAYLVADDTAPILSPERQRVVTEWAEIAKADARKVIGSVDLPISYGPLLSCAVYAAGSALWVVNGSYAGYLDQPETTVRAKRSEYFLKAGERFQLSPLFAITAAGEVRAAVMPIRPTPEAVELLLARPELRIEERL